MKDEQPWIHPYLAILIAVLSVSTSAILVKLASADAGIIAMYRLLFTVIIMSPYILTKQIKAILQLNKRAFYLCLISGLFLACHFILWFESLNLTTVTSSVVLVTLQPLFAFAGTMIFFKEKLTALAYLGGLVSIFGSLIISWGDFKMSGMAFYGDMLSLLACAMITGYLLIGQKLRKDLSLSVYTYIVYLSATIVLFLYTFVHKSQIIPDQSIDWLYFLMLAIFPTLLGHSIFNWVVKWVSTSVISMSILGEPIGASILAYLILHETPKLTQIIGGLVILIGLGLFMQGERHQRLKVKQKKMA